MWLQRLQRIKRTNNKVNGILHELGYVGRAQLFTNSLENCHSCLIMWYAVFTLFLIKEVGNKGRISIHGRLI